MYGIVLPLQETDQAPIHSIWAELTRRFDMSLQPELPHVSLHIAAAYDTAALYPIIHQQAASLSPLTLRTSGLGLFTGPEPVLYVSVVCGRDLLHLHTTLWPLLEPTSQGSNPYYQPHHWVPHLTLAHGPRLHDCLPDVIRWLGTQNFHWSLPISHLTFINNALTTHETWPLQGSWSV